MNYSVIKKLNSLFRDNIHLFLNLNLRDTFHLDNDLLGSDKWVLGVIGEVGPRIFPHQIQDLDFYLSGLVTTYIFILSLTIGSCSRNVNSDDGAIYSWIQSGSQMALILKD